MSYENARFLLLILRRFVADVDTSAGVDGYIRHGHGRGIRDKQGTDTIVVDGQFLNPFTVDLLGLMDFDVVDQFVQHPRRQLLGTGILADGRQEHICGDGITAELARLFAV